MFLYILKNEAMPDLYKVGISADPEQRATALSNSSGVPAKFEVIHKIDCVTEGVARRCEALAHFILEHQRVNTGREFFKLEHENVGVHSIVVAAFLGWRADRPLDEWRSFISDLSAWPFDRSAA